MSYIVSPHPDQFNLEAFLADHAKRAMQPGNPAILVAHPAVGPIGRVTHERGFQLAKGMSGRAFSAMLRDERAWKENPSHARWKRMNKRRLELLQSELGTITTFGGIMAARSDAAYCDDFLGYKASQTTVANQWSHFARSGGTPSAASYTAAASNGAIMTNASAGAWPLTHVANRKKYLLNVMAMHVTGVNIVCLADLLYAAGAISTTTTSATNITHPTLTRSVDGNGVQMILEVDAALGSTASNVTINYDAATADSQTTGAIAMTASCITYRTQPLSSGGLVTDLAAGSGGVKAVNSVTFSASMGGSGTVAVLLYNPLMLMPTLTAATNWAERPVANVMADINELMYGSDSAHGFLTFFANCSTTSTGIQSYFIQTVDG